VTRIAYADPSRVSGLIDESVVALFTFPPAAPGKAAATATFHTSFVLFPPEGAPCCTVIGTKGKLMIDFPASRPGRLTLETHGMKGSPAHTQWVKDEVKTEVINFVSPGGCRGFVFEMDETARCVRDGKIESDVVPARATLLAIEIFDEIRRQAGLKYADALEAV